LIFELFNFFFCIIVIATQFRPEFNTFEIPIFTNFGWFFCECVKASSSKLFSWAAAEALVITITLTGDPN